MVFQTVTLCIGNTPVNANSQVSEQEINGILHIIKQHLKKKVRDRSGLEKP